MNIIAEITGYVVNLILIGGFAGISIPELQGNTRVDLDRKSVV